MAGLKIKVEMDLTEVIELRDMLKECREDAKQLGFTKRQLRRLIKTISCEDSSYREFVKHGYQPTSRIATKPPNCGSSVQHG